ncbi:hypothetical protein V8C37DRAFT_364408 [Trichoderma ceciliae]
MTTSASEKCRACITTLKTMLSILSHPDRHKGQIRHEQVDNELQKFCLWAGNIGALHPPKSPMSLETRLREANDILTHIMEILNWVNEVAGDLLDIVSEKRKGRMHSTISDTGNEIVQIEEMEFLDEIGASIARLFRASSLIRQAAPTDLFTKALSRNRYRFNDQFDIAHVGAKYPKLAGKEYVWLQKRLGRAITQRRHYLSYIQDHREKLEINIPDEEIITSIKTPSTKSGLQPPKEQSVAGRSVPDSSSRAPTYFTTASSLAPGYITPEMLAVKEEEPEYEDDARSYTTISRSVDGDQDYSLVDRIPKLESLQLGAKEEVECPFCFRLKRFKNERLWRRHVFSDLRPYLCTFADCDAPYFLDINEWFRHEMQYHRVTFTCRLCQSKTFELKERYLAHIKKQHPEILKDINEQLILDIAKTSVEQIPAQECPFCTEWADRLKKRTETTSEAPDNIICATPIVFKRHVTSHLEQLALFAIPIGLTAGGDDDSNVAIQEDLSALNDDTDLSVLTFDSSRPPSPKVVEKPSDAIVFTSESPKSFTRNYLGRNPRLRRQFSTEAVYDAQLTMDNKSQ